MRFEKLNIDTKIEILKRIKTIEDLKNFCNLNKQNVEICKNNHHTISKIMLKNYKVDYTDPTNFIYVKNKKNIDDYRENGSWKYKSLFKLYMTDYYKKVLYCTGKFTSFPFYPNLKVLDSSYFKSLSWREQDKFKKDLLQIQNTLDIEGEYFDAGDLRIQITGLDINLTSPKSSTLGVSTIPNDIPDDIDMHELEERIYDILDKYGLSYGSVDFEDENQLIYTHDNQLADSWQANVGRIYPYMVGDV